MPAIQAIVPLLQKALPLLAKQIPKLWPLLLDAKNREKLMSLAKDVASASPKRKLAGRMELTELLAQRVEQEASSEDEREKAAEWSRRAKKLRARLDMPMASGKARREHRAKLKADLQRLHAEMSDALSE